MARLWAPLETIDQHIASAAMRLERARVAVAKRTESWRDNPIGRDRAVSSREAWLTLGDAPGPIASAARAWVAKLTLDRVLWQDELRIEDALDLATIELDTVGLARERTSPRALVHRIVRERDDERRDVLARALATADATRRASEAARYFEERREEAARQLGVDRDALELPCAAASLTHAAERVLGITDEIGISGSDHWHVMIDRTLARDADQGWPARLQPRWVDEVLGGNAFRDGAPLGDVRLPDAIGATSFARAFASFGDALARLTVPPSAPFVLAFQPFDVRRARRAALFASVAAQPSWQARALGLGRGRARDQARTIARGMATSLRVLAMKCALRRVLARPERAVWERAEEASMRALGAAMPRFVAGVFPRLTASDGVALIGACLGALDRRAMVERFDEDWFNNPRAARAMREEDGVVQLPALLSNESVEAALAALALDARELA
jgi:hypothetical protein